jgi:pyruvate-ferredoxin/flavodoxin oxidoreductase
MELLERTGHPAPGGAGCGTLLLNSPYGPEGSLGSAAALSAAAHHRPWGCAVRHRRLATRADFGGSARTRTNTILQTCFFAISGVLPRDEAIGSIKKSIKKTYGRKGEDVVQTQLPRGR